VNFCVIGHWIGGGFRYQSMPLLNYRAAMVEQGVHWVNVILE